MWSRFSQPALPRAWWLRLGPPGKRELWINSFRVQCRLFRLAARRLHGETSLDQCGRIHPLCIGCRGKAVVANSSGNNGGVVSSSQRWLLLRWGSGSSRSNSTNSTGSGNGGSNGSSIGSNWLPRLSSNGSNGSNSSLSSGIGSSSGSRTVSTTVSTKERT